MQQSINYTQNVYACSNHLLPFDRNALKRAISSGPLRAKLLSVLTRTCTAISARSHNTQACSDDGPTKHTSKCSMCSRITAMHNDTPVHNVVVCVCLPHSMTARVARVVKVGRAHSPRARSSPAAAAQMSRYSTCVCVHVYYNSISLVACFEARRVCSIRLRAGSKCMLYKLDCQGVSTGSIQIQSQNLPIDGRTAFSMRMFARGSLECPALFLATLQDLRSKQFTRVATPAA